MIQEGSLSQEFSFTKPDHLLQFDGRGLLHCDQTLANHLPGLDPGLTALSASEGLLAGATLVALVSAYGTEGSFRILKTAGVIYWQPATKELALARLGAKRAIRSFK